jgi:hypothetical protein
MRAQGRRWGLGLLVLACASSAGAEEAPGSYALSAAFGPVAFVEGSGTGAGIACVVPTGPRWGVGIEANYLHATPRERGAVVGLNLVRRWGGRAGRVRPYGLVGVGFFNGDRNWSGSSGVTGSAGLGVQLFLSRTLFLAPELRVGYVPMARATVAVGYSR